MCLTTRSIPTIAQEDIFGLKFTVRQPETKEYSSIYMDCKFKMRKNRNLKKVALGITSSDGYNINEDVNVVREGYHAYVGDLRCNKEGFGIIKSLSIETSTGILLDSFLSNSMSGGIREVWKIVIPKGTKIILDKKQYHIVAETMKYVEQVV